MLNIYKERVKSFNDNLIKECFEVISTCCSTQPEGFLIGGNFALKMKHNQEGDYVPFMYQIPFGEKDPKKIETFSCVELYSYDGYMDIADIAHWADIANDMIMAKAAGCDKYDCSKNQLMK